MHLRSIADFPQMEVMKIGSLLSQRSSENLGHRFPLTGGLRQTNTKLKGESFESEFTHENYYRTYIYRSFSHIV